MKAGRILITISELPNFTRLSQEGKNLYSIVLLHINMHLLVERARVFNHTQRFGRRERFSNYFWLLLLGLQYLNYFVIATSFGS